MKILITGGLAISPTVREQEDCQPYEWIREDLGEVKIGDTVVVSYDGNQEILEVSVNPTEGRVKRMEKRCKDFSRILAEIVADDKGSTPENWKNYLTDGYPLMVWYKVVKSEVDVDDADMEVEDMKELL